MQTPAATLTWSSERHSYKLQTSDRFLMWIELGTEEVAQTLQERSPILSPTARSGKEIASTATEQGLDLEMTMVVTRLSPPQLPATLVVRERLLAAVDTALSRPLTLLSAAAGWGKTTLLATWAHRHPQVVAWLPLEEMDNDPTRFWLSLIEALRRCWPDIGATSNQPTEEIRVC